MRAVLLASLVIGLPTAGNAMPGGEPRISGEELRNSTGTNLIQVAAKVVAVPVKAVAATATTVVATAATVVAHPTSHNAICAQASLTPNGQLIFLAVEKARDNGVIKSRAECDGKVTQAGELAKTVAELELGADYRGAMQTMTKEIGACACERAF